jgi:CO dehydrogenase/acetyl-CoA synthase beta subunit
LESLDIYINRLDEYVDEVRKRRQIKRIICPASVAELTAGLPINVGKKKEATIILKEDTAVELGNPSVASRAFVLWTSNPNLLVDGRITIIGPDIQESLGKSLPFAQILMVHGRELKDQHHLVLEQHYAISNQIEGYMVRLAPQRQRMWTRVSKNAAERGFSFETLGRAIMAIYKSELPVIETAEVLFITSSKEDVEALESIAAEIQKIKDNALSSRFLSTDNGSYECTSEYLDCRDCPDQAVCDEIRDLVRLKRKKRQRDNLH